MNAAAEARSKATGMNIQHLTEKPNRPATGVVTDKGVPQSDSFAKYAASFQDIPFISNPLQLFLKTADLGLSIRLLFVGGRIRTVLLYPGVKAVGGDIKTCRNAGNIITTIKKCLIASILNS